MNIKIIQRPGTAKKDGTVPIVIRVTKDRKTRYIPTGFSVAPKNFKEGDSGWVVRHTDALFINDKIEEKRTEVLTGTIRAERSPMILDVLAARQTQHEKRDQSAAWHKLNAIIQNVKKGCNNIPAGEITLPWVNAFIDYRYSQGVKTISIKKDLTVFIGALENMGYNEQALLFKKLQKQLKAEEETKDKLTREEVEKMEAASLTGLEDLARDMFLFAYYAHGMRFENVATFKAPDAGVITYRMNKGRKIREIDIHPKLQAIIDKYRHNSPYLFPLVKEPVITAWNKKDVIGRPNSLINKYLKKIAFKLDIHKRLTTHVSRHSFAFQTLERAVSHSVIQNALGHSSIRTTEGYLKSLSDKQINDEVNGLYE